MSLEHRQFGDRSQFVLLRVDDRTRVRHVSWRMCPVWYKGTTRSNDHDHGHGDDTSRGTTPENEIRASTLRHGKYRPVYRAEAAMRSEGTGTAATGSSQRQRRIAVEPWKPPRHKVGRTRFHEEPPTGTPSQVGSGTTGHTPTRNPILSFLVYSAILSGQTLSRAPRLLCSTPRSCSREPSARENSGSAAVHSGVAFYVYVVS